MSRVTGFLKLEMLPLAFAAAVFISVLLPQTKYYSYFYDDFVNFNQAQAISENFEAVLSVNKKNRRLPFFSTVIFLESRIFGQHPQAYFLVLYVLHFLNALWVRKLAYRLGACPSAALLSAMLFFCSSAAYQALIFIPSTAVVLAAFFFLAGIARWFDFMVSQNKSMFLTIMALQLLSVLTYEVSVVFPLFVLFLTCIYVDDKKKRRNLLLKYVSPLVIIQVAYVIISFLDSRMMKLFCNKITADVFSLFIPRLISLIHALAVPLLVPGKGYFTSGIMGNYFVRFLPALILSSYVLFLLLGKGAWNKMSKMIFTKNVAVPACLVAISIIPFMANKLMFEHTTRYLYLPMVGFSIVFGVLGEAFMSLVRAVYSRQTYFVCVAILVYIFTMNIFNTSFHFQRYQQYLVEHPDCSFNGQVNKIFEAL